MEIVFGRDPNSGKLKITCNGREVLWGEAGAVDNSVSRRHCQLDMDDEGNKTLINLNPANETNLNGQFIVRKRFELNDNTVVKLGANNYILDLKRILPSIGVKETYSIRHLKKIIEDYQAAKLKMQIDERKQNALRGLTPIFMTLGAVLGFIPGIGDGLRIVLIVVSLFFTCYFGYLGFFAASKNPQRHAELDREYQSKCVCPNEKCGRFLSGTYDQILRGGACPYCHSRFKE